MLIYLGCAILVLLFPPWLFSIWLIERFKRRIYQLHGQVNGLEAPNNNNEEINEFN